MMQKMVELLRNARVFPLSALTRANGLTPDKEAEAYQCIAKTNVVVGADNMTRQLFLVHGREMVDAWLESRPGLPEARVVIIELDEDGPEDLTILLAAVSALHGHDDYRGGEGFLGQASELDRPVIEPVAWDGPVLWAGGSIASMMAAVREGVLSPTNTLPSPHVKPIVWVCAAEHQEAMRSAAAGWRAGSGRHVDTYLGRPQSMRIGIRAELAPVNWDEYVRTSGIPPKLADSASRRRPPGWPDMGVLHGSYTGIPRSDWLALEILDDLGRWMPLTERRLLQTDGLLSALSAERPPTWL